jgi:hypothetical protein
MVLENHQITGEFNGRKAHQRALSTNVDATLTSK